MSASLDPALADEFARIAEEAGREIMRHYLAGGAVRLKNDMTPVTAADEAAEAIIQPALAALLKDVPCVAEEAVASGHVPHIDRDGRFLLVDPLDGTREFLLGNGEFTVNIALVEDRRPVLGVVHLPALGATYVGGPRGATLSTGGGRPEPIGARPRPAGGVIVLASRAHNKGDALERFLENEQVAERIAAGSSLKFCRVAEGLADLYPRFGRTMEWDTAAGHAVLAAAGGSVRLVTGEPLTYGKPGFVNPDFIARGRW